MTVRRSANKGASALIVDDISNNVELRLPDPASGNDYEARDLASPKPA